MFRAVLLPQQLERHELVGLQFVMERSVVRFGKLAANRRGIRAREQRSPKPVVIPVGDLAPRQACRSRGLQVFRDGRLTLGSNPPAPPIQQLRAIWR
jgi:hypothetical protein